MPVGSSSEPTWKTNIRRSVPSWVAARPTPIASRIRPILRLASAARAASISVTGRDAAALDRPHRRARGPKHRLSEFDDLRQDSGTPLERLMVDALGLASL